MDERLYRDPSRLFTIRVPEGFERDPRAKSLVFRNPDIDGAVTVSCLRHRLEDANVNLFDALPSRDNMQNMQRYQREGMSVIYGDYEGTLKNEAEYWRWWTLQRGPVGIVVSFNGSPNAADEQSVDELVGGIHINERPPIGAEDFTQRAAEVYASTLKKDKPAILRPLELSTGEKSVLRLDNAYIGYLDAWDKDDRTDPVELLNGWLELLWGEQDKDLGPFEDIRGMIYPVVRAAGYGKDTKVPVLRRELVAGELDLLAVVDTGRTLRFVSRDDIERWEGIDEEDIFFYARENLSALSQDLQLQALADNDGNPRAVIIATHDSYDASRLVLPELYNKLSEVIGPNLLAGVPNRDFMIVLTADDAELVENVSAQVKVDSETRPYSISGKLYKLTKDGVESR
ncbi:MAG: DUF1444 family protein [Planctomycetes bacterium]|nr:DUF1444 family protein [Planctomycetota bacterium]